MARRRARDDLTGRQWAVDQIAEWLRSGTGNLVVTGGAGTGKTALVAALAAGGACTERVGPLHAVHLCRGHVIASIDPVRVLADIARQLTRSVPGYAACLRRLGRGRRGPDDDARFAAELTLESTNLSDAYDTVLRLPFQALSTGRGRSGAPAGSTDVVVAVDGLDETPPGSGATGLADMFAERTTAPTPGLRLILTTRSGPPLDRLRPQATVDLVADCPPGIDAIGEYLHAASGLAARWRAAIAEAAAGCPLYADVVCRITGTRLDLAGVELPSGLDALYDHLVVAACEREPLAGPALRVLARTRDAGLATECVAAVLGAEPAHVHAALADSRALLAGFTQLRPHHRCFAERLCATTPDPTTVDWLMAQYLNGRRRLRQPDGSAAYVLRNLFTHLADAAADGSCALADLTLRDALADAGHLTAAVVGVGVDDVLTSLSYVERRTASSVPEVAALTGFLRRQAGGMRAAREQGDAALVTQQLAYEAAAAGARGLGRAFAKQLGDAGILTMWTTRDGAARPLPHAAPGEAAVSPARPGHPGAEQPGTSHTGEVTEIAVTGDATKAITAAKDGTTRVWRLASGRLLHATPAVVVAPGGVAQPGAQVTGPTTEGQPTTRDTRVRLPLVGASGPRLARIAAFATDPSRTTGVSGELDGQATVWDLITGEPILRLPCGSAVVAVAVAADTGVAATATAHGDVATWDLVSGAPLGRLPGHPTVTALALTPRADRLLVGGDCLAVYALPPDAEPRLLARLLTSHPVTAIAVNPAMPGYAVFGAADGQVGYVRLPADRSAVGSSR